jgi:hypothetical protein
MQTGCAGAQQFLALPRGVFDAELHCRLVVRAEGIQFCAQRRGNFRAALPSEFSYLRRAQNGDDARHERHRDAEFAGDVIAEFKKIRIVEKKLRDHKVRAGLDFFPQMPPIGVLALLAGDVAFGKTGDAGGKIPLLTDEIDQLGRIFKAAGRGLKFAAAGRVAAQGQNVFAVERADFFQQRADFVARVVDASEMGERGQAVLALDTIHNLQSLLARAAAGAVGDRAKIRPSRQQRGNLFFKQRPVAFVGLGRKKLQGDDGLAGGLFFGVNVADEAHGFELRLTGLTLPEIQPDAKQKSTHLDMMI